MNKTNHLAVWQQWLHRPKKLWFRKVLFQIHLWSAISVGLYIFFISVTGSVLVYRNELFVIATPEPIYSTAAGPILNDSQLTVAASRSYPGYLITRISRPYNPEQAVEIWLEQDNKTKKRRFDARTGEDVASAGTAGITLVSNLMEIHSDLLAGDQGRKINGIAAFAVLLVILTGLIIWWPGISRWRSSLVLHKNVGWKRFNWELHSMMGFWSFGFILIFTVSGIYLCFPQSFHDFADTIQPVTTENVANRFVDSVLYWLAFLHFGRINGIGIPCGGPGLCDQSVKAVWAIAGLAPAAMFVTGATMWWNRVLRRWWRQATKRHFLKK